MNAALPTRPPRTFRAFRWGLSMAMGTLVAMAVLALLPPPHRATLPAEPESRGESFEKALAAALTKVRTEDEEWAVSIDPADVNAWLATRLPKWIAHDPTLDRFSGATTLRIASKPGALWIEDAVFGGRLRVSVPVDIAVEAGHLEVRVGVARLGRLPLPGVGSAVAESVRAGLDGLELQRRASEVPLADGRVVEVRDVSCEEARVALRFATRLAPHGGG